MNRIYGLTVDQVANPQAILAGLSALPHCTLRIVIEDGSQPADYVDACKLLAPVADLMLQPVDSSAMSKYRLRQYSQRFADSLQVLGQFAKYLECGNEVNGNWLGTAWEVADKVNNAITQAKRFGITPVVTYYYDGDAPEQMQNWAGAFPLNPDIALVSVYPNSSQQRPSFDAMFTALQAMFPGLPKGFGEYGTEDPQGNNGSSLVLRGNLVRVVERYTPPDNVSGYVGGGFYWDAYLDAFLPPGGLLSVFKQAWAA